MQQPKRIAVGQEIYLNLLPCDKFKTNFISIDFLAPSSEDTVAAYALLPPVLARGTVHHPDLTSLTKAQDMLYGSRIFTYAGSVGDVRYFGLSATPIADMYADSFPVTERVLDLMGEMLLEPYTENGKLSPAYTDSEKNTMIDRIRAQSNDKNALAVRRCKEIMFSGDPYALPSTGTVEQVQKITPDILTDTLHRAITTMPIEIYLIGIYDEESILTHVKKLFGGIERCPIQLTQKPPHPVNDTIRRVTEVQKVKQGKLCLGFRTGTLISDRNFPAYDVFCTLLSSSPIAKLFLGVREKKGLCYYCSALSDPTKDVMIVASGIEPQNSNKAEEAILAEIEACRRGEFSAEEWNAVRKIFRSFPDSISDDPVSIKNWYFRLQRFGISESPAEYAERCLQVGESDVIGIAEKIRLDTVFFLKGTLLADDAADPDETACLPE